MSAPSFKTSDSRVAHIRNLAFWKKTVQFVPGSVVVITGAGSGIARQCARIYASRGTYFSIPYFL